MKNYVALPAHPRIVFFSPSEVTCNLCLSPEDDFEGGELRFEGLRGQTEELQEEERFTLRQGTMVMHEGSHLHAVSTLISGEREVVILWSRNYRSHRDRWCPCCTMNRRMGECVGGGKRK